MRHRCPAILAAALLLAAAAGFSQERRTAVAFTGSLSTESKLFTNVSSPDDLARASYFPFGARLGGGVDIRRTVPDLHLTFGLSAEYLAASGTFVLPASSLSPGSASDFPVTVHDGYSLMPVELTAYFTIPLGAEDTRLYIGGGTGVYAGERNFMVGPARAANVERSPGFGIHVLTGVEFDLSSLLTMRCEVKFRDAHFSSTDRFTSASTVVSGQTIALPPTPLDSRVNVDGMDLSLHLACRF